MWGDYVAVTHLPTSLFGLFPAALLRLSPAVLALDILAHLSGHITTLGNLLGLNREKKRINVLSSTEGKR